MYSPQGSRDSLLYSPPGSCFGHQEVALPILRSIQQQSLKGLAFKEFTVGYFTYLGTCDLCLKQWPDPRDSSRLHGVVATCVKSSSQTSSPAQAVFSTFLCLTWLCRFMSARAYPIMSKSWHNLQHNPEFSHVCCLIQKHKPFTILFSEKIFGSKMFVIFGGLQQSSLAILGLTDWKS